MVLGLGSHKRLHILILVSLVHFVITVEYLVLIITANTQEYLAALIK